MNAQKLPYVVLYTDPTFNVPEGILFFAEDNEETEAQLEEQLLNKNAKATITWVVQTDTIEKGFTAYHEESTCEEY